MLTAQDTQQCSSVQETWPVEREGHLGDCCFCFLFPFSLTGEQLVLTGLNGSQPRGHLQSGISEKLSSTCKMPSLLEKYFLNIHLRAAHYLGRPPPTPPPLP